MSITELIEIAGQVFEAAGVLAMLAGIAAAFVAGAVTARRRGAAVAYRDLGGRIGRAILLGLELLVAGDIIRTVVEVPTLERVGALAGIVAIRTFLSVAIEVELEGRWPWRRE